MGDRKRAVLVCDECGARNYETTRKKTDTNRLTIKKFCPQCARHTVHRESK